MKAVILAGGLGERLKPLTEVLPKPLLPVNGKPIMQYCIENLKKYGVKDIILSIGYKADLIKSYFNEGKEFDVNLFYNIENEPLGTGGAVKEIIKKFDISDNFILIWGDNLGNFNISKLIEEHEKNEGLITMTLTEREDVENFGVAKLSDKMIEKFVEKPKREEAPSNLINAGAFVVEASALDILPEGKSNIERECFSILANEGKVFAFAHKGYWYPTDTLEKYNLAENEFKKIEEEKTKMPALVRDILKDKDLSEVFISLNYKNWRGELIDRKVIPLSIFFGKNEHHKEEQWLMEAYDLDKNDYRTYALKDISAWKRLP